MPWFMLTPLATYAVGLVFSVALEAGKNHFYETVSKKGFLKKM